MTAAKLTTVDWVKHPDSGTQPSFT